MDSKRRESDQPQSAVDLTEKWAAAPAPPAGEGKEACSS